MLHSHRQWSQQPGLFSPFGWGYIGFSSSMARCSPFRSLWCIWFYELPVMAEPQAGVVLVWLCPARQSSLSWEQPCAPQAAFLPSRGVDVTPCSDPVRSCDPLTKPAPTQTPINSSVPRRASIPPPTAVASTPLAWRSCSTALQKPFYLMQIKVHSQAQDFHLALELYWHPHLTAFSWQPD